MIKYILLIVFTLSTGCKNQIDSKNSLLPKPKSPDTNITKEQLESFDFKTTHLFTKDILLRNEDRTIAKNTLVTIYYNNATNSQDIVGKFYTNQDGILKLSISIPNHVDMLKLKYRGHASVISKP